jgi:hypothetical protein
MDFKIVIRHGKKQKKDTRKPANLHLRRIKMRKEVNYLCDNQNCSVVLGSTAIGTKYSEHGESSKPTIARDFDSCQDLFCSWECHGLYMKTKIGTEITTLQNAEGA